MMQRGWPKGATVGICRGILKLASHMVPSGRRREWVEEWESELWHWWDRSGSRGASAARSVVLIAGAIPHAAWERKEDWTADKVMQDLRYAARQVRRKPGFTFVAVLTLGLGIGANTTVFTLLNGLLLRQLPGVREPAKLVQLARVQQGRDFDRISYPNYVDLRNATRSLVGVAAHYESGLFVSTGVDTRQVSGQIVSDNYFDVLGVTPMVGRTFAPHEGEGAGAGANAVVVISDRFWQREFGGSPSAVGASLQIARSSFEVVGVAASGFAGTEIASEPIDIWVPMTMANRAQGRSAQDDRFSRRGTSFIRMFGRMGAGTQIDEVRAEMELIAAQLRSASPTNGGLRGIAVVRGLGLVPRDRDEMKAMGAILGAAVAIVLLITCANLANLLLVRATARTRELAVRAALGASRGRLVRQLLTESILLSLGGGVAAVAFTLWSSQFLSLLLPTPVAVEFGFDGRVFAFALAVALGTGVLFGILPAWSTSKTDVVASLKGTAAVPDRHKFSARNFLVVAQLALCVVLVVSAGLLLRSVRNVKNADPGFATRDVLVMSINVERAGYTKERGALFFDRLLEQVESVPGVVSAAISETIPIAHFPSGRAVFTSSEPLSPGQRAPQLRFNIVSPGFFRTLGIPVTRGREFTDADDADAPRVAIVNEALAASVWPGEDPIGKTLYYPERNNGLTPIEVVGIARNSQMRSLRAPPIPFMFLPFAQDYEAIMRLHIRTAGDPMSSVTGVLRRIHELDEALPVYGVSTLHERVIGSMGDTKMSAILITVFGALAVLLAVVGLYGTVAYAVSQRHRELGVRLALGAQRIDVFTMVLRQGLVLAVIGVTIGMVGAVNVTRFVRGLLYGIAPTDPATFGTIAALLVVVSCVASYVPARRATRVDPINALRAE